MDCVSGLHLPCNGRNNLSFSEQVPNGSDILIHYR